MICALDIETYPDTNMIDKLPEPEITKNLKDPEKIANAKIEAKEKQLQDMALNPLYGKIASYCFYNLDFVAKNCIENEFELLYEIKEIFSDTWFKESSLMLITWKGSSFDLPFIYKRFILNGIKPCVSLSHWTSRYNENHIDLMQIWAGYGNYGKYEKLDTVSKALFNCGKKEFDFRKIPELLLTENGRNEILEYNIHDAKLTFDLYKSFKGILF